MSVHVRRKSAAASAGSDGPGPERLHAGREGSGAKSAEGRQTWRCCSSVTPAKYYRMCLYVRGSVVQEEKRHNRCFVSAAIITTVP